jgi:hypothetical protein
MRLPIVFIVMTIAIGASQSTPAASVSSFDFLDSGGDIYTVALRCSDKDRIVVAQGDSWFNYAPHKWDFFNSTGDILNDLFYNAELPASAKSGAMPRQRYCPVSIAQAGKKLSEMNTEGELNKFSRVLRVLKKKQIRPVAILLSGGGNDTYESFSDIVRPFDKKWLTYKDEDISAHIDDFIDQQKAAALIATMLDAMTLQLDSLMHLQDEMYGTHVPILVHGYDYAVPDGYSPSTSFGNVTGPWLAPAFNGYDNRTLKRIEGKAAYDIHWVRSHRTSEMLKRLNIATAVVRSLIDQWNMALGDLVARDKYRGSVVYVDLRGRLVPSKDRPFALSVKNWEQNSPYLKAWQNELHPNVLGFERVTAAFADALDELPISTESASVP